MTRRIILPYDHLPERAPVIPTIILLMAVDVWDLPEWAAALIVLWLAIAWAAAIYAAFTSRAVPIPGYGTRRNENGGAR